MDRKNKSGMSCVLFIICCVVINCAGKAICRHFELPLWLDNIGTLLCAYFMGPWWAALVGASLNILYSRVYEPTCVYCIASIAAGIIAGFSAKKGYLDRFFSTLSTAFALTIATVIICMPLNYRFLGGYTGNKWGDAVIDYLQTQGFGMLTSSVIGEFYMDFADKMIIFIILYLIIRAYKKGLNRAMISLFFALVIIAASPVIAKAGYDSYFQLVYNNRNGLTGGIATDIEQTDNGVLWVGTYNGLYRYSGGSFEWMKDYESVKNVSCLYKDSENRIWIGTSDRGVSIAYHGSISDILDKENGLDSNSVKCVVGTGHRYYVGTTGALALVDCQYDLTVKKIYSEITYVNSLAMDSEGRVAAVTNSGFLYVLDNTAIKARLVNSDPAVDFTCCGFDKEGRLFVGTAENKITVFNKEYKKIGDIVCTELTNIKEINFDRGGKAFVCADNGAGYFERDLVYYPINTGGFNSSIDHSLVDFQGNLWFTSSRLGLLKLCYSPFTPVYDKAKIPSKVVNCVTRWQDVFYFGTDSGLDIADNELKNPLETPLSKSLAGVRIRHLAVDKNDNLWIATSGKGVWRVDTAGNIKVFNSSTGTMGDKFRMVMEKKDGSIWLAGDIGISVIKDDRVVQRFGYESSLDYTKILCMQEDVSGDVYVGTDGNGITVIRDNRIIKRLGTEDGLSSQVVMRICPVGAGYVIVTGNGLCYMDSSRIIKPLDKFPYNNNFDVLGEFDDNLVIFSSAGIYLMKKDVLLANDEMEYTLFDNKRGMNSAITPNSWTYIDKYNNFYIPCDTGVIKTSLNELNMPISNCKIRLQKLILDGKTEIVAQGSEINIPTGVKRIEFMPEIIDYSVNDPLVSIYLQGANEEPIEMRQSDATAVAYTNLPSGEYKLRLAVLNRRKEIIYEAAYPVHKEYELYETTAFRIYFILVLVLSNIYLGWLIFRTQVSRTLNIQRRELELAQKQLKMSNEAIITIAKTVDAKDNYTSKHSERVSEYSVKIAKRLNFTEEQQEELRKTALLHDIGKIGISDSILKKPGRLTDEEYEVMKSHVVKGAEILQNFTAVENIVEGALYHHERYDGRGYVNGLKGEEIPINARIIGIADAFDAMTANRVYRKKLSLETVIGELERGKGKQFDPELVDIMLDLIDKGEIDVTALYEE